MTFSSEIDAELHGFSGIAPIFPLPSVVLFPHALLPLHIFEPRYRQMTADALDGERLIAMALMRPVSEPSPAHDKPPIHPIMGLGKIIAHDKQADGRYYLILRGLARVNLLHEQDNDLPYRVGQFEVCQELVPEIPTFDRSERAEELVSLFGKTFPDVELKKLFTSAVGELPLQTVCDILLSSIPLPPDQLQSFLNELDVDSRSQKLFVLLQKTVKVITQSQPVRSRTFPPGFSKN